MYRCKKKGRSCRFSLSPCLEVDAYHNLIVTISEDDYFRYIQLNTSRINKIRSNSVVEYISERLLSLMAYTKLQCKLPHLADLFIKAHILSYASILS
ncbi:hypothetical protein HMPREF0367_01715 [[Eubacterium] cylindroides ATCC 27803]|uniref:Uncharacterized protein n=1 Tax=Faecalitalea cylindroides ATCC 27803 TaxID=649755 RepID=U2PDC9_9FIRM|nr:hypothetical protein HMPREF0367_01715 [[Eubacterium] cylindroides ATCC 27803] [Faecalitalea cylindroides ATCC 27803]